jgi:hypothetical protein
MTTSEKRFRLRCIDKLGFTLRGDESLGSLQDDERQ